MTIKKRRLNRAPEFQDQILKIQPFVLFRMTHDAGSRKGSALLHVKNAMDDSFFEIKGKAAYLWLLLDGRRTVSEVIREAKRLARVKKSDSTFEKRALEFFKSITTAELVLEVTSKPLLDSRVSDMRIFLRSLQRRLTRYRSVRGRRANRPRFVSEDSGSLRRARLKFSRVVNGKRLRLKKDFPGAYEGKFHMFSAEIEWQNGTSVGQGAGLSAEGSAISAIAEAIERHFSFPKHCDLHAKSFTELKRAGCKVIDPRHCQFFDSTQTVVTTGEVVNLQKDLKCDWVLFEKAFNKKEKFYLPAPFNNVSVANGGKPIILEPSSSGCAAGTSPEQAKFNALLEVIERDALLFYWRTQNAPFRIDLSKPPERLKKYFEIMGGLRRRISFFYLKTELTPTTVQAVIRGDVSRGEPYFASTCATSMDPIEAIEKSLCELLHLLESVIRAPQKTKEINYGRDLENSFWDLSDRVHFYRFEKKNDAFRFLFSEKNKMIGCQDLRASERQSYDQNLQNLLQEMRRHKLKVFFRSNAPSSVTTKGLWVYRAFSPDLIHFDGLHRFRELGHPRYFLLAKKLNLMKKPDKPDQLNPWPHPLP